MHEETFVAISFNSSAVIIKLLFSLKVGNVIIYQTTSVANFNNFTIKHRLPTLKPIPILCKN